ncbi:MAG: thioredoxin family protein [Candidatus Omnitrophota bacterium]
MKKLFICFSISAILCTVRMGAAHADISTNSEAPEFTLTDSHGQTHSLSGFKGKYVILEWVNYDCPFVKKHYTPGNMQGLQKSLTEEGAVWLSINSSAEGKQGAYSADEVNQIMENSGAMPTAYLFDTDGTVGKMYGAKTTPHMYVINPEGVLIYQGAIDSISSFDSADIKAADNYVIKALSQAKSGEAVSTPTTQPYGCSVKY